MELHHDKPLKLTEKVLVPIKEFPKFNFVGKILGPQGNSLKRLQEITGARIGVYGKGSARGKKEEEIRKDPVKAALLDEELHVSVEVNGVTTADAYEKMGFALSELRKFLIPTREDDISAQQWAELMAINPDAARGRGSAPRSRGAPRGMAARGAPRGGPGAGRGAPRGAAGRGAPLGTPGARGLLRGAPRGAPRGRGAPAAAPAVDYYAQQQFPTYDPTYQAYEQYDQTYEQAATDGQYYNFGEQWPAEDSSYGKLPAARGAPRSRPYAPRGAAIY